MTDQDLSAQLQQAVTDAADTGTPLCITGGGTKAVLGREAHGEPLATSGHRGIVSYEPTELVITARAGTTLRELDAALAAQNQMLPFEPPHFGAGATLGGTIACGLSGPRRPYTGAARDFVLGTRVLTGKGEILSFGGEVMKNVAGYDASRLMTGAMGTLGVLLEVSLKVLPGPATEASMVLEMDMDDALHTMNRWAGQPLPLSATCYDGAHLTVRLSGASEATEAATRKVGGSPVTDSAAFWEDLREQRHGFFADERPLWRLSVAPAARMPALPGKWLLEWGGAQRWFIGDAPADKVRAAAAAAGGHATLFRGGDRSGDVFQPLSPGLMAVHTNLKHAFDPAGILNPQRMYAAW